MATVSETELKQRVAELVIFIRDYAVNYNNDAKIIDKQNGFIITIFDKDVTVEFGL